MVIEEMPENSRPYSAVNHRNNINLQNKVLAANKKPTTYKSIFRTASVLICLSKGITSVTDIASNCNIHKSAAHRLLQALGEAGLTMQDPISRRYHIGPLLTEVMSDPNVTHELLVSCTIREMKHLADFTGESIGLHILIGLQCILLHEIQSAHDFSISAKKKVIEHLHAGANTKVLLSQLNNNDMKIALANMVLEPLTEHTIIDKEQLMAQLKQIRRQGHNISYGERIVGGINLSVPIRNYILPASISILGPESCIKPRTAEFLDELIAAGARVSQNLTRVFKTR